jgi:iron(III) transport system ATP-binding protein
MAAVELNSLTKRYGAVAAVDDLSATIAHGSLVCLLGPSGCGKTTTLRLIAGFADLDGGTIRVGERIVSEPGRSLPPEKRNMSMIFQSYALWPHMTIAENVAYGLRVRKVERAERERRVAAILDVAHLSELAPRYPHELSGGQQQRAALARALVVDPETLLLDEPLSNLDANLREEMRFEIRRLHDQYRYTTVYVTHDQSEAMTTADLIAVMNAGRIDQLGTPEDIYDRPQSEFVARFIGASNIIRGVARDANHVAFAGATLEVVGTRLAAGDAAAVAIRQHDIALSARAPQTSQNVIAARVTRQVFLGATRDYLVEAADGSQLRVVTAPDNLVAPGTEVWLSLPPARCRALAR